MLWDMLIMAMVWVVWNKQNNRIFIIKLCLPLIYLNLILYFAEFWAEHLPLPLKRKVHTSVGKSAGDPRVDCGLVTPLLVVHWCLLVVMALVLGGVFQMVVLMLWMLTGLVFRSLEWYMVFRSLEWYRRLCSFLGSWLFIVFLLGCRSW